MFGANLKKGQALLFQQLCPNGNCPQDGSCLLRHLRRPVVTTRPIEQSGSGSMNLREEPLPLPNVGQEEEDLRRVMAESRKTSFLCPHSKVPHHEMSDLQEHLGLGECTGKTICFRSFNTCFSKPSSILSLGNCLRRTLDFLDNLDLCGFSFFSSKS